jgi:hypothetical protein
MKRKGKQEPAQKHWQKVLGAYHHLYAICYTWEEGRDIITDYLDGKIIRIGDNHHA